MADISVVGRSTKLGMPATRMLGPALGSLHMFFHRLGPNLARRLLLTGDSIEAGEPDHLSVFTDIVDDDAATANADWWPRKVARMPADGPGPATGASRLLAATPAYHGQDATHTPIHT